MSYYQFNRNEILQKAKKNYSKEKDAKYYLRNKEAIKKDKKKIGTKIWKTKKNKQKNNIEKIITGNSELIKMNYCCKKQNKVKKWLITTAWKKKFRLLRLLKICEKGRKDHIFVSFRMFSFHGNIIFSELSLKWKGKKAACFRKCVF